METPHDLKTKPPIRNDYHAAFNDKQEVAGIRGFKEEVPNHLRFSASVQSKDTPSWVIPSQSFKDLTHWSSMKLAIPLLFLGLIRLS